MTQNQKKAIKILIKNILYVTVVGFGFASLLYTGMLGRFTEDSWCILPFLCLAIYEYYKYILDDIENK